jgi:hypothetical protein
MGHIIHVTGPFSSLDYDGHIWNDSYESIGLWNGVDENNPEHSKRFEVFLGDNHYMNSPHCAVPIKKDNGKLDATETQYNNYFGSTRSTVEQAFAYLKTWTIISGVYRGLLMRETGYNFLSTAVNFCCELYNARFTILGTKKREIRVYARDETGVPLCPPPNLTPENLRVRLNIHNQLSRFNKLSEEIFYLSKDIDSRNTSSSFSTGAHVWVLMENQQDFIKANITGCVNGLFSIRSADKKYAATGTPPSLVFPRVKNSIDKPIIEHFVLSAQASIPSNDVMTDNANFSHSTSTSRLTDASHEDEARAPITNAWPLNDDHGDSSEDEVFFLDEEFLDEMGIAVDGEDDERPDSDSDADDPSTAIDIEVDDESQHDQSVEVELQQEWRKFSEVKPLSILCTSHRGDIELTKRDASKLLDRHWLNDQIMNFFTQSCNQHNIEQELTSAEDVNQQQSYICNTWLFSKFSSMSSHGELGNYSYHGVRRYFRQQPRSPWDLDIISIPVSLQASYWLCCILKVREKELLMKLSGKTSLVRAFTGILSGTGTLVRTLVRNKYFTGRMTDFLVHWYTGEPLVHHW